jgi:hypothetical protein
MAGTTTDTDSEASRVASQAMNAAGVGGARPPRPQLARRARRPAAPRRAPASVSSRCARPRPRTHAPASPPHPPPPPAAGNPLVFKFSLTPSSSSSRPLSKNGVHWAENTAAPFHVTDSTLSAEAIRLVSSRLSGGKALLDITGASTGAKTFLAVKDGSTYYLVMCNDQATALPVRVDLTAWGVGAGTQVCWLQLPAGRAGCALAGWDHAAAAPAEEPLADPARCARRPAGGGAAGVRRRVGRGA